MNYEPKTYWEQRHTQLAGLRATGHIEHGGYYNWWLYRAKVRALRRALTIAGVDVRGRSILDVGAGTGFFLSLYARWGAGRLAGVDISAASVRHLKANFPAATVWQADIAQGVPTQEQFDIVQAFDVMYHLPDVEFSAALNHLVQHCRPGGVVLLTDSFRMQQRPAPHVTFRSLAQYQEVLSPRDAGVVGIVPIYRFLNRGGWLGRGPRWFYVGAAADALAPLYYLADSVAMNAETANLSLLTYRVGR
jgi:2-polyprenyl-3-methyl-5-hydroxy-6-metoxy-1,4-benzoquinol methylase